MLSYDDVVTQLELYQSRYDMTRQVKARVDENPYYLDTYPTHPPASRLEAATVLNQLGFEKEAEKLAKDIKLGEVLPDLYAPKEFEDMLPLFIGAPTMPDLFAPKALPEPTPVEIEEAIKDMSDLTVFYIKKIDTILCDVKSKPYSPKFIACVKAIEMYY